MKTGCPPTERNARTGLVTPPADVDALAKALAWLLSHPDRLAGMGRAARERVLQRFGAAAFAEAGAAIMARLPPQPVTPSAAGLRPSAIPEGSGRSA